MNAFQFEAPWNPWFENEGPFIEMDANLEEQGQYDCKLLDTEGEELLSLKIDLQQGYNTFKLDASALRGTLEEDKIIVELSLKDTTFRQVISIVN